MIVTFPHKLFVYIWLLRLSYCICILRRKKNQNYCEISLPNSWNITPLQLHKCIVFVISSFCVFVLHYFRSNVSFNMFTAFRASQYGQTLVKQLPLENGRWSVNSCTLNIYTIGFMIAYTEWTWNHQHDKCVFDVLSVVNFLFKTLVYCCRTDLRFTLISSLDRVTAWVNSRHTWDQLGKIILICTYLDCGPQSPIGYSHVHRELTI